MFYVLVSIQLSFTMNIYRRRLTYDAVNTRAKIDIFR